MRNNRRFLDPNTATDHFALLKLFQCFLLKINHHSHCEGESIKTDWFLFVYMSEIRHSGSTAPSALGSWEHT